MKKIFACLFAVTIISTAAFSKNFFTQRFFEVKVGSDVSISNNLFSANELLQKNLVIDLRKLADECPSSGFGIRASADPSVAINLNILNFHLGFSSGLELYDTVGIGKDLFTFLGYGNQVGQTLNFNFTNDSDIFFVSKIDVGLKLGKIKFTVTPSLFLPLVSVQNGQGVASITNDANGNLNVRMNMAMPVYSFLDLKTTQNGFTFDFEKLQSALLTGYGFDIGGDVSFAFTKSFTIGANCRIPMIPGRLRHKSLVQTGFEYSMNMTDGSQPQQHMDAVQISNTAADLAISRPLKFGAYIDKNLLGTLFNVHVGGGFGMKRPFTELSVFYPEYYVGLTFNLIDVFKVCVSTEYRDQMFIHQVGTTVNVRLFQIDLGVSSQSANFKKSLAVAGVGAYAYVSVGF